MRNPSWIKSIILIGILSFTALFAANKYLRVSGPAPSKAFYFWKVRWAPTPAELQSLVELGINRLYLRFFDVGWDLHNNYPTPMAPIQFKSPIPPNTEVIPVVFIKNLVFLKLNRADVPKFA